MSMITLDADIVSMGEVVTLSNGTKINRYSHVCKGAQIGDDCMVGQGCYIAADTVIGHRTRIQNTNNIWRGVVLGNDVFVAPAVCFTNHNSPQDRFERENFTPDKTIVGDRATICTNVTIVAPCIIGEDSLCAAGSVILANVPSGYRAFGVYKGANR